MMEVQVQTPPTPPVMTLLLQVRKRRGHPEKPEGREDTDILVLLEAAAVAVPPLQGPAGPRSTSPRS